MNFNFVHSIMPYKPRVIRRLPSVLLASSLSVVTVLPGFTAEPSASSAAAPQSATAVLIKRLAERGVIGKDDAAELLLVAEADAAEARAQSALAQAALAQAVAAEARARAYALQPPAKNEPVAIGPAGLPAAVPVVVSVPVTAPVAAVAAPEPAPSMRTSSEEVVPPDTVRVTYVPEVVKKQLREEIKQEVMQQARDENWAAPRTLPEWINRFNFFGDFRLRFERTMYPEGNSAFFSSSWWNFNAINTAGTPYDYKGVANAPFPNVDQNRTACAHGRGARPVRRISGRAPAGDRRKQFSCHPKPDVRGSRRRPGGQLQQVRRVAGPRLSPL
jgi:hypothetical protein